MLDACDITVFNLFAVRAFYIYLLIFAFVFIWMNVSYRSERENLSNEIARLKSVNEALAGANKVHHVHHYNENEE